LSHAETALCTAEAFGGGSVFKKAGIAIEYQSTKTLLGFVSAN
jgi:hypothetical protein